MFLASELKFIMIFFLEHTQKKKGIQLLEINIKFKAALLNVWKILVSQIKIMWSDQHTETEKLK